MKVILRSLLGGMTEDDIPQDWHRAGRFKRVYRNPVKRGWNDDFDPICRDIVRTFVFRGECGNWPLPGTPVYEEVIGA